MIMDAWYEQIRKGEEVQFTRHDIMGANPADNRYGLVVSELHSVNLVDMDGDGLKDIITGKTYYSHHKQSPGWDAGAVVVWFKLVRTKDGVDWIPNRAADDTGIGRQLGVFDLNQDALPDILVGGMKGCHVLLQSRKSVDQSTWQKSQPTLYKPSEKELAATARDQETKNRSTLATGELPKSGDGAVLNFDFEKGSLADWSATGEAFTGQPIAGDAVAARRSDMRSQHQGKYWIGSFERKGDQPTGTLVSSTFKIVQPYATFLVGGGDSPETRVEIVDKAKEQVLAKYSGRGTEAMHLIVVDLKAHLGREVFVRLIDNASGGWGHINFDDFRLHSEQPGPTTPSDNPLVADQYPFKGQSAGPAAQAMKVPTGFRVIPAAAEPDVKQPIAMALDDRGRVWIAEAYEYPNRAKGDKGRDRILIFEDTNGDGTLENRKVFAEGLNLVSGLEVGFGGAWVGAAPYLLFIADKDGDDVADGEPQILLDGWGYQDTHETLNTFIWGPDGWLYGCHGVFTHSRVGKPGTPDAARIPINAGIWRYHPTRHQFEVFAHGTSNPWGVDFNDRGQAFLTSCVIPHLYHIIQGARYERQAGNHFNPHTYDDIKTVADHFHYLGAKPHGGNGRSDAAGGGHAHAGAMIYLGGTWPEQYRDKIFMNNIHGQRLNMDVLAPSGSGYVGSHGPDFLLTGDQASQILNLRYGPDGQCWMIDWYDMQACHLNDAERHDRSNGRVYKIVYGENKSQSVDLTKLSDDELAGLVTHENDWYVRHSRRLLQERSSQRPIAKVAIARLTKVALSHQDETRRLRAAWALACAGQFTADTRDRLLVDESPYVRGWAIQLSLGGTPASASLLEDFAALAKNDSSPVVRLYIASAAGRLPADQRWEILDGLVSHALHAKDHNLPLMVWYAAEPLAESNPQRALDFALRAGKNIPLIRDYMLRRIGSRADAQAVATLVEGLRKAQEVELQLAFLDAIRTSLTGQRRVAPPRGWAAVSKTLVSSSDSRVKLQAEALGVTFGDEQALAAVRKRVLTPAGELPQRRESLAALLAAKDPKLTDVLQSLLDESLMREQALAGLAQVSDPRTAEWILTRYAILNQAEKRTALATLSARPESAIAMLRAVEQKKISENDLSADLVRQLQYLKNDEVTKLLTKTWGTVRETAADKAKLIEEYKQLVATAKGKPDLGHGRAVFARTCQQCHALFSVGGNVGPDLTGSNRTNLDYLLSNIVDPSAVMAKEYQPTVVLTGDGRVITGIARGEDDKAIKLQTATALEVVPKDEIEDRKLTPQSMMPDDQLKQFTPDEVLALITYMGTPAQVPLLADEKNAMNLFNGKDLSGWRGAEELWSVENGELVGRSSGLKHNEFLVSDMAAANFKLTFEVKLVDNAGNSGVQFRSTPQEEGVQGYQADIGKGWWGKLYEEEGRGLLWPKSGEEYVKEGDWNSYEILANGRKIQTRINGNLCVDLDDAPGARRGIFALQLHSGGPTEVRYRNFRLEVK